MKKASIRLLVAAAATALACGGDAKPGIGEPDGAAGMTGSGGGGAIGGRGGTDGGGECMFPECVAALVRDCPAMGSCVQQRSGTGSNICFSNGVKFMISVDIMRGVAATRITKTDGLTTCYSLEAPIGGDVPTATYKTHRGPPWPPSPPTRMETSWSPASASHPSSFLPVAG